MPDELDQPGINGLLFLAADARERTEYGDSRTSFGAAPMASVLWTRKPRHYLRDPYWFDRDRLAGRCRDTRRSDGLGAESPEAANAARQPLNGRARRSAPRRPRAVERIGRRDRADPDRRRRRGRVDCLRGGASAHYGFDMEQVRWRARSMLKMSGRTYEH